jgi:hypothetical protein
VETEQIDQNKHKKEILFPNGNRAQAILAQADTPASKLIKALNIEPPKALILVIGGAAGFEESLKSRIIRLFSRGIARGAVGTGALIIDGGTQAGVMAIMGQGVEDRGRKSPLLGVAPAGKVTYPGKPSGDSRKDSASLDPNHSHFVLVESNEWGGELNTFSALADEFAKEIPVVTILANGGLHAREEVLRAVRRDWPIIIIEGSGRLADEIATAWRKRLSSMDDSVMREIIGDGSIHIFSIEDRAKRLEALIRQHLNIDKTLQLAWERFAMYDANAIRQQSILNNLQPLILALGVIAVLLALTQHELVFGAYRIIVEDSWPHKVLHYAIIILPITISFLIALANRFKAGNKWILLRANAEAIKREIFRYRARAVIYRDQGQPKMSRKLKLTRKIESISRQLMQTDVNLSALRPYKGPTPPRMYGAAEFDDGFSLLTPDRYVTIRLGNQLNYYRSKTNKLERQLKFFHLLIYIFGGIGTLLAAAGLDLWIALTTALAGMFTTYLETQQVENTLMKYNQAATDLANVEAWWVALSENERKDYENIDKLVGHTETILKSELTGWVQEMQDALAELRAKQTEEAPVLNDF